MNKLISFFLVFTIATSVFAQPLSVVNLTCEYRTDPLGIDKSAPRLNWKLRSNQYQVTQTAYQILVADNLQDLQQNKGTCWDSKKITSSQSIQIPYQGRALKSAKTYFWKVKVWDNKNNVSWSSTAFWQMGLLKPEDWSKAKWIAYEKLGDSLVNNLPTDGKKDTFIGNNVLPIFRKSFEVQKTVKKATMFISGLGHFELTLNGKKIGDHFLDPGWTKYDKEALYVTFDLSNQLSKGKNAIGVMLGNGFYYVPPVKDRYRKLKVAFGYPKMICLLKVEYTDGTISDIVTDETWKTSPSPITFSSIYGGEDYNANLHQQGWDEAIFNDNAWKNAIAVPGPNLNSQKEEPVKILEEFEVKNWTKLPNGEFVGDFGQNSSAIFELKVSGNKGDTVKILPGEILKSDGTVSQKNIGGPSYFTYVLKGGGTEIWRPKFTYTGFRYVQVKGAKPKGMETGLNEPILEDLKVLHVRNAAQKVGNFHSSNELFNQTFNLIDWSIKSNMVSVFTDCPHREKLGWLEQLHLMGNSVRYNYDAAPLFKKALQDMKNSQLANGLVPEIAPEYVKFEWGGDMFRDSPEWGSSSILLPWYLYQWYGDRQSLDEYYPMMQRYIKYLGTKANGHILSQGLGDWYDLGPKPPGVSQLTPMGVTGTAIYYHDLKILTKIAMLLGKNADALTYSKLATEVKKAFNSKFFNSETKQYATGSQTANAMAIYMGLVEDRYRNAVIDNLVKDIRTNENRLTAGDIGYRYLLRVLEDAGKSNVIFDMNSRTDVPGYGMQIAKGATALTESWAALTTVSNNHFMLGHLMEWFYTGIGGIRNDGQALAFKKIKIYPEVVGNLTSAKVSYSAPYGDIVTEWTKTTTTFSLDVTIPANTTATVYLPSNKSQRISEANKVKFQLLGYENGRAKIAIGSGNYQFNVND